MVKSNNITVTTRVQNNKPVTTATIHFKYRKTDRKNTGCKIWNQPKQRKHKREMWVLQDDKK